MIETVTGEEINAALDRARTYAPFLCRQAERQGPLVDLIAAGRWQDALATAHLHEDAADPGAELRRARHAIALTLGVADLAGVMPLEEITARLSAFADRAIDMAVRTAIDGRTPGAGGGFAVIALGKLGGGELNYSSDVDLLFLYDPATLPLRPREEPQQGATRIAQRVTELLQARTEAGFAFRVDLRLRPSPEATPVALPVDAAISYYESSALPWERAAFIRARAAAGDRGLGARFLAAINPFVWRRSLDFGAFAEVRALTRRIRGHYAGGQHFGPGYDLKRGRGGIREIEFFAQAHQLIHGGRDPSLRSPATGQALAALAAAGKVPAPEAAELTDAYRLLRTIEHRLQMVEDRQTHVLPREPEALAAVAGLHAVASGAALLALIEPAIRRVDALYSALDDEPEAQLPRAASAMDDRLAALGFADAPAARARIAAWRDAPPPALRTAAASDAFEALLPQLVETLGRSPAPSTALARFDTLVRGLPSGINFFRLLEARPRLLEIVATILAHAPPLAEQLGRRPELLDGLLDASALDLPPPVDDLVVEFRRAERAGEDYGLVLDRVRRQVNERRFALGVQLLLARYDPLELAGGYARVAEAAITVLATAATAEFERVHGSVPGGELVILGLGRLGGEALTHASDLDLVYLFTGDFAAHSTGAKPLGATDYFNRLAQRVSAALSVRTAAGPLYQVDTRLRPSGADGLLAISLDSFRAYQHEQAWLWEHMALVRARPVFGSGAARGALQAILDDALRRPRDPSEIARAAAAMRADMAAAKPPGGPFDVKLIDGGLVDLEFALHVLQLATGQGLHPQLRRAVAALIDAKLIPAEIAGAHRLLGRLLLTLRLVSPSSAEPPPASQALVAEACLFEDWPALLAGYAAARHRVSELWSEVRRRW